MYLREGYLFLVWVSVGLFFISLRVVWGSISGVGRIERLGIVGLG